MYIACSDFSKQSVVGGGVILFPSSRRASAWAGERGDPQGNARDGEARRTEGRNSTIGEGMAGKSGSAKDRAFTSRGNNGDDDDEDETEAVKETRKMRDSMASDAQRLTSEFAAGRLTAPHFFGAMLVSCVTAW